MPDRSAIVEAIAAARLAAFDARWGVGSGSLKTFREQVSCDLEALAGLGMVVVSAEDYQYLLDRTEQFAMHRFDADDSVLIAPDRSSPVTGHNLVPAAGTFPCPMAYGGHERDGSGGIASCDVYVYDGADLKSATRVGRIEHAFDGWRAVPGPPDASVGRARYRSAEAATCALAEWWSQ